MSKPLNADQLFNAALKLLCERSDEYLTPAEAIQGAVDLRTQVDLYLQRQVEVPAQTIEVSATTTHQPAPPVTQVTV